MIQQQSEICSATIYIHSYIRGYMIFQTSRYQGIVRATVSRVFQDLKFKISEGSDLAETASWAESGQLQFWSEPSDILNLRSSNTLETVAFTIP